MGCSSSKESTPVSVPRPELQIKKEAIEVNQRAFDNIAPPEVVDVVAPAAPAPASILRTALSHAPITSNNLPKADPAPLEASGGGTQYAGRIDSADYVEEDEVDDFFWTTERRIEDDYELKQLLGKGQFGSVFAATHIQTGEKFAVKRIDKLKTKRLYIDGEVMAMRVCRKHPFVVTLFCVYETPSYVYLVIELMEGGELFERLVSLGAYSEKDAREPIRCVAEALAFMHARNLIHRDLKPENLLLSTASPLGEKGGGEVKLADFGLSKQVDPNRKVTTVCGTWAYSAPEMRAPGKPGYDAKVDCWALGIIMYILLSGYHPFDPQGEADQATILESIQHARFDFVDPVWNGVSDQAKELIIALLQPDPAQRMSAAEVLNHPWMRNAYLSQEPLNPHIAEDLDRYRKKMAAKMRASMIVAMASVFMMQSVAGRRWSAPSVPLASAAKAAAGDVRDLPTVPADKETLPEAFDLPQPQPTPPSGAAAPKKTMASLLGNMVAAAKNMQDPAFAGKGRRADKDDGALGKSAVATATSRIKHEKTDGVYKSFRKGGGSDSEDLKEAEALAATTVISRTDSASNVRNVNIRNHGSAATPPREHSAAPAAVNPPPRKRSIFGKSPSVGRRHSISDLSEISRSSGGTERIRGRAGYNDGNIISSTKKDRNSDPNRTQAHNNLDAPATTAHRVVTETPAPLVKTASAKKLRAVQVGMEREKAAVAAAVSLSLVPNEMSPVQLVRRMSGPAPPAVPPTTRGGSVRNLNITGVDSPMPGGAGVGAPASPAAAAAADAMSLNMNHLIAVHLAKQRMQADEDEALMQQHLPHQGLGTRSRAGSLLANNGTTSPTFSPSASGVNVLEMGSNPNSFSYGDINSGLVNTTGNTTPSVGLARVAGAATRRRLSVTRIGLDIDELLNDTASSVVTAADDATVLSGSHPASFVSVRSSPKAAHLINGNVAVGGGTPVGQATPGGGNDPFHTSASNSIEVQTVSSFNNAKGRHLRPPPVILEAVPTTPSHSSPALGSGKDELRTDKDVLQAQAFRRASALRGSIASQANSVMSELGETYADEGLPDDVGDFPAHDPSQAGRLRLSRSVDENEEEDIRAKFKEMARENELQKQRILEMEREREARERDLADEREKFRRLSQSQAVTMEMLQTLKEQGLEQLLAQERGQEQEQEQDQGPRQRREQGQELDPEQGKDDSGFSSPSTDSHKENRQTTNVTASSSGKKEFAPENTVGISSATSKHSTTTSSSYRPNSTLNVLLSSPTNSNYNSTASPTKSPAAPSTTTGKLTSPPSKKQEISLEEAQKLVRETTRAVKRLSEKPRVPTQRQILASSPPSKVAAASAAPASNHGATVHFPSSVSQSGSIDSGRGSSVQLVPAMPAPGSDRANRRKSVLEALNSRSSNMGADLSQMGVSAVSSLSASSPDHVDRSGFRNRHSSNAPAEAYGVNSSSVRFVAPEAGAIQIAAATASSLAAVRKRRASARLHSSPSANANNANEAYVSNVSSARSHAASRPAPPVYAHSLLLSQESDSPGKAIANAKSNFLNQQNNNSTNSHNLNIRPSLAPRENEPAELRPRSRSDLMAEERSRSLADDQLSIDVPDAMPGSVPSSLHSSTEHEGSPSAQSQGSARYVEPEPPRTVAFVTDVQPSNHRNRGLMTLRASAASAVGTMLPGQTN